MFPPGATTALGLFVSLQKLNAMNNASRLYKEDVPLRLRQAGLHAIQLAGNTRLCIDPKKTTAEKVEFFVRLPSGKPDRRHPDIKKITARVAEIYAGKVKDNAGTLSLDTGDKTAEKAPAKTEAKSEAKTETKADDSKKSTAKTGK